MNSRHFLPHRFFTTILLILFLTVTGISTSMAQQPGTSRVSIASDGTQGNGSSGDPAISADGRYVAFRSWASNLVSSDTNDTWDIFVHDRQTGEISPISMASDGSQGDSLSYSPSISADGRYVAFVSEATNLVSGDTNNAPDIFVHDRQTGETSRVSVASDGSQGNAGSYRPSVSGNGNYVTFDSEATNLVPGDTNNGSDIFVHDRQTGETSRVSVASDGSQEEDGWAYDPSISADGRYVAFESTAGNLVPQDDNVCIDYMGDPYNCTDIFVHDRQTAQTSRVSVASDDTQGNDVSLEVSISANGRYVAFESSATNLVADDTNEACYDYGTVYNCEDVFVRDRGGVAQSEVYLPVVIK